MGNATIVISFLGTIVCLGLAVYVYARAHRAEEPAPRLPKGEGTKGEADGMPETDSTAHIDAGEVFSAIDRMGGAEQAEVDATAHIDQREIFTAMDRMSGAQQTEVDGTAHIDRREIFSAIDRMSGAQEAEVDPTALIDQREIFSAIDRTDPTAHIDQREIFSAIDRMSGGRVDPTPPIAQHAILSTIGQRRGAHTEQLRKAEQAVRDPESMKTPEQLDGASRASAPKLDPMSAQPPAPRSVEPEISREILAQGFSAAVDGLEQLAALPASLDLAGRQLIEQRDWAEHVGVLGLSPTVTADTIVVPVIKRRGAPPIQRTAAALILLRLVEAEGPARLLALLDDLDENGHEAVMRALTLARGPQVDATIQRGLGKAEAPRRSRWLELLRDRGERPTADTVERALVSSDEAEVALGYHFLLAQHDLVSAARQLKGHIFKAPARVREAALIVGLALGIPGAKIKCKTSARAPEFGQLFALVSMLCPDRDLAKLADWAERTSASPHAGWGMGVSGRRRGLEACVARLGHGDAEIVTEAIAGLRAGAGLPLELETGTAAKRWWQQHQGKFGADLRYMGGEELQPPLVPKLLVAPDTARGQALALELLVRSKGALLLPRRAMPSHLASMFRGLDVDELRFGEAFW